VLTSAFGALAFGADADADPSKVHASLVGHLPCFTRSSISGQREDRDVEWFSPSIFVFSAAEVLNSIGEGRPIACSSCGLRSSIADFTPFELNTRTAAGAAGGAGAAADWHPTPASRDATIQKGMLHGHIQ
jgi:hypothetical protein